MKCTGQQTALICIFPTHTYTDPTLGRFVKMHSPLGDIHGAEICAK